MKAVQIESVMKFEATTTEANEKGFYFKLANNWTLTIGPDIWWVTDDQKRLNSYGSILSRTNLMILYDQFKRNIKNKKRHLVKIHMSIIRTTDGTCTTVINLFLNGAYKNDYHSLMGKDFTQRDNVASILSYGILKIRQKGEPEYRKDADLGDKAQWAVIKILIRRLCENSMI